MNAQRSSISFGTRDGFVLPSVVFSVAMMSVIVVVSLSTASDERRASRAVRESTLSEYMAEAGLRQTYGAWPSTQVKAMNPGDSLDLGWQTLPNSGKYRAVIHRVDKGGLQEYDVVVQGRRTDLNGGMSNVLGIVGGVPVFTQAVYAKTNVSLSGGGLINSYDSDVAPYTAATADSAANIISNGSMNIQQTTVQGDATAAGTITFGQFGVVTGTTTSNAPPAPAMDINTCPAAGFTPAGSVPTGAGISYSASTGVLTVTSGAVLNLTGGPYYFSRVILSGNSSLAVNPPAGSRIEVFVSDSLNLSGGSVTNLSGNPTRLGFSSCGTANPAGTWSITGGSAADFSVYAPDHPVLITGSGDLYGSVVALTYTATGGANLHYDAALSRIGSTKLMVQRATWALLPGT